MLNNYKSEKYTKINIYFCSALNRLTSMKQQLLSLIFAFTFLSVTAQVGIGTSSPDASSVLDVTASDKGLLIPRVALTGSDDETTIANPVESLLVYNTATSNDVTPGFYYWDGLFWEALTAYSDIPSPAPPPSSDGWQLDGNNLNGKANDGTTFLGTTTYHSLYFKVDGDQIGRLHPNGGIALGLGASSSVNQAFAIGENASAGNTSNYAYGKAANASGSDAYAIGASSISSQTDSYALGKSATASGTSSYAIGEASKASHSNSYALGAGADSRATGSFAIGNQSVSSSNNTMALGNQSSATSNNATAIGYQANASNQNAIAIGPATTSVDNSIILGNTTNTTTDSYAATKVGIGTSNPSAKLHVNGTLRYVDGNEGNGKVMTSDANGNVSWQDASSGSSGGLSVYGEIYVGTGYRLSDINTTNRIVSFGEVGPNKGLNSLSSSRIQTREVTGVYKFTYTINLYRRRDRGFLKFYVAEYSNEVANSSSFVDFNNDSEYVTITKSFLVNISNTYRGFDLYMQTIDNDDNNEWDDLEILEGTSLRIELVD